MKKKVCLVVAGVLAFCTAGVIASRNNNANRNDTLAANVEALSNTEGGSAKTWQCWSQLKESDMSITTMCGDPCKEKKGYVGVGLSSECYSNDN